MHIRLIFKTCTILEEVNTPSKITEWKNELLNNADKAFGRDSQSKTELKKVTAEKDRLIKNGETGACWDSMGVIKQCQDLHFRAGRQD